MPGDKIRELLRATLPVGTGDLAYDAGKSAMSENDPMAIVQQMAPAGGIQTASITKLMASPAFRQMSPVEQAVIRYIQKIMPLSGEIAANTSVVPHSEWKAALDARRNRAGLPPMNTAGATGAFFPGGNEIMVKGLSKWGKPHDLAERLVHEIRHAFNQKRLIRDKYAGDRLKYMLDIAEGPNAGEMLAADEALAYPTGRAARERVKQLGAK